MPDRSLVDRIVLLEERYRLQEESNDKIIAKLDKIDSELVRYKGFIGGIAFVGGAIFTAFSLFKEHLLALFK
jgi:hypothetical protein